LRKAFLPAGVNQSKKESIELLYYKGIMMKRHKQSTIFGLLILIIGLFLAVTVTGCIDPVASECQEKHLRLGEIAKQQLQYGLSSYTLTTQQGEIFYPAQ
jgi:hypothetical protein